MITETMATKEEERHNLPKLSPRRPWTWTTKPLKFCPLNGTLTVSSRLGLPKERIKNNFTQDSDRPEKIHHRQYMLNGKTKEPKHWQGDIKTT